MAKVTMYGIDISDWQEGIDLSKYKGQFAIIRAGYGNKVEYTFEEQAKQCKQYGIPIGAYWYSYALNEEEAKEEAELFLKTVKGYDIEVGLWLDMEDADGFKKKNGALNKTRISNICKAFCKVVSDAGYYTGIYASESWFGSYITGVSAYDKWVASWGSNDGTLQNDTSALGTLHQFTSKPLDRNVMYVDIGVYSKGKTKPTKTTTTTKKPAVTSTQSLKKGDTVTFVKAVDYTGTKLNVQGNYTVMEVSGDRIVVGRGGIVTAAVKASNLKKVTAAKPAATKPASTAKPSAIKVGDKVKVINNQIYGKLARFHVYYKEYTVMELKGDRAVIGVNGVITTAINVKNIKKL